VSDGFVLLANAVPLKKAQVRIDARGRVMKIAGYHSDASRIPEAVRRLAEQQFPQSRVREYESELQRGIGRVHEVKVTTRDGRKCEVSADDRAQLLYVECHVPPARLPAPIAQAVKTALPGGEIVEVETKKGPNVERTEVKVKAGGRVHKLHFDASARLVGHFLKIPAEIEVQVRP
jgi:hypothetical protein